MPFYAYILRSQRTGGFYIGHTENLRKRLFEHNNNRTDSIRDRGPCHRLAVTGPPIRLDLA
jgi:putative endonuclease